MMVLTAKLICFSIDVLFDAQYEVVCKLSGRVSDETKEVVRATRPCSSHASHKTPRGHYFNGRPLDSEENHVIECENGWIE